MGGDTVQQAQQFLESIFGVGHTYSVFDGDYGKWMNIAVDDDDVHELHIEIQSIEDHIASLHKKSLKLRKDSKDIVFFNTEHEFFRNLKSEIKT